MRRAGPGSRSPSACPCSRQQGASTRTPFFKKDLDGDLYLKKYICMKTTLNLPDPVVREAKRQALEEATTLTDLIVQGLKARLERGKQVEALPISVAEGGLRAGLGWEKLEAAEDEGEAYR